MGCNCKNEKNIDSYLSDGTKPNDSIGKSIVSYIFKTLVFLLMIVALPIINLFIIWFIFRTVILNKEVNVKPLLLAIGKKFQPKHDEELDEDDYNELTEDDVEMVDVEEITNKSK